MSEKKVYSEGDVVSAQVYPGIVARVSDQMRQAYANLSEKPQNGVVRGEGRSQGVEFSLKSRDNGMMEVVIPMISLKNMILVTAAKKEEDQSPNLQSQAVLT